MKTKKTTIRVHGATIIVDPDAGTLRPRTRRDGVRLGVGSWPATTDEHQRQREARDEAIDMATAVAGMPVFGWTWVDPETGHPFYLR